MIKPWFFAPLVALIAVIVSGLWWQSEKDRWKPPPARKPDLPSVAAMPPPMPVLAKQALESPLFWASRRPVEVDDKKGGLAKELTEARLTAVLESGTQRVAILLRADGTTLKINNETKPWRLDSFDGRKAVFFAQGDQRVEKQLEVLAPAAATSADRGPARARMPSVTQ